jgi:hypothetical protein
MTNALFQQVMVCWQVLDKQEWTQAVGTLGDVSALLWTRRGEKPSLPLPALLQAMLQLLQQLRQAAAAAAGVGKNSSSSNSSKRSAKAAAAAVQISQGAAAYAYESLLGLLCCGLCGLTNTDEPLIYVILAWQASAIEVTAELELYMRAAAAAAGEPAAAAALKAVMDMCQQHDTGGVECGYNTFRYALPHLSVSEGEPPSEVFWYACMHGRVEKDGKRPRENNVWVPQCGLGHAV